MKPFWLLIALVFSSTLVSCSVSKRERLPDVLVTISPTQTATVTALLTSTAVSPSQTATVTASLTPIPSQISVTPLPTLTADEAKKHVRKLLENNAGCQLPCWWGITPGKTTWVEARHFLESFSIYVGETGGVSVPLPSPYSDATRMDHGYSIDDNGVVKFIKIYNFNLAPNYYLPKFLETYGQPTEIYIRTDRKAEMDIQPFLLDLYYQDKGILIEYSTGDPLKENGEKLLNCHLQEADSPFIYLWSPEKDKLSFDEAKQMFLDVTWLPEPKPLLDATGMTIESFYQIFKNPEPGICLETKKDLWP